MSRFGRLVEIAGFVEMDISELNNDIGSSNDEFWLNEIEVFWTEAILNHIFFINGEEDPNVEIKNELITPEVIEFYNKATYPERKSYGGI